MDRARDLVSNVTALVALTTDATALGRGYGRRCERSVFKLKQTQEDVVSNPNSTAQR